MNLPLTIVISLVFTSLACQRNAAPRDAADTEIGVTQTMIEGIRWNLDDLPGVTGNLPEIAKAVFIRLDSGRVSGFAGCNSLFGSYSVQGDSLRFNPVGSTKKFCDTGMEVETRVLEGLTLTNRFSHSQGRLQLFRDDSLLVVFNSATP